MLDEDYLTPELFVRQTDLESKFLDSPKRGLYIIEGHKFNGIPNCHYLSINTNAVLYSAPIHSDIGRIVEVSNKYAQIRDYANSNYSFNFQFKAKDDIVQPHFDISTVVNKNNFEDFARFVGETAKFIIEEYKLSQEKAKRIKAETKNFNPEGKRKFEPSPTRI